MDLSVCLISREYCEDVTFGGIGRAVGMQARLLRDAGAEVCVVTVAADETPVNEIVDGIHLVRIPEPRTDPWHADHVRIGAWSMVVDHVYRQLDADHQFDVVETPDYGGEGLHLVPRDETAYVVWLHAIRAITNRYLDAHDLPPSTRGAEDLELAALHHADAVIAPTELVRETTAKLLRRPLRRTVSLPLLFDFDAWPVRTSAPADGPLRLLTFGRLERLKAPELALHPLAELRRRGVDARLTVVGRDMGTRGSYRDTFLLPLAHELGVADAVDVRPSASAAALRQLFHESDCAILPSRFDNFHCAALETLSSGLPLVTSDRTGVAQYLDRGDGFWTLPVDDPHAFGERAADVLAGRSALAAAGERIARHVRARLDPGRTMQALVGLYEELLAAKRSPRLTALAWGDEILADPELLEGYGSAFAASDPVTLKVVTTAVDELATVAERAGFLADDSPELLIVDTPPHLVDVVYSRRRHPVDVPHAGDATALRAALAARSAA